MIIIGVKKHIFNLKTIEPKFGSLISRIWENFFLAETPDVNPEREFPI